jgi:subtilisin-like proprotein convertase family protein
VEPLRELQLRMVTYTVTGFTPVTETYSVTVTGGGGGTVPLLVCSTFVNTLIPDNTPTTFTSFMLTVSGGPTSISDVNVFVDANTTFSTDLDFFLTSPLGTRIELSTDNGSSADDTYSSVIFDDSAATAITALTTPGTYRPEGLLSTFNGESANGVWILEVLDDTSADFGCLARFCLAFDGVTITQTATGCTFAAPSIDQARSVTHTNNHTIAGTDSVLGADLSGDDLNPDFLGVRSNTSLTSGSRVFVIPIAINGAILSSTTVNTTNISIFGLSEFTAGVDGGFIPSSAYTVSYSTSTNNITLTMAGGTSGRILTPGGIYVISLTTSITNRFGTPFSTPPSGPVNSVVFMTAPDYSTTIGPGLTPGCATFCHTGAQPLSVPSVLGGIANPTGTDNGITLNFTTNALITTSLARTDGVTTGRSYVSLGVGQLPGFATLDPRGTVLGNKMSSMAAFGGEMPFGSTGYENSPTTITGAPINPNTGATYTQGDYFLEVLSWIRAGALSTTAQ